MGRFFTRERFGRPQVLAAMLLLAFLAQCLWLVERGWRGGAIDPEEIYRLERGAALWERRGIGATGYMLTTPDGPELDPSVQRALSNGDYDANHSNLWYLIAAAPLALSPVLLEPRNIVWPRSLTLFLVCCWALPCGMSPAGCSATQEDMSP
jgi:hypothetical protein